MADGDALTDSTDLSKLKVPDLKKELKSRGLNTTGNKNELIERLQAALKSNSKVSNESVDDLDEDLLNEDDDDHLETTESVISDIDTALIESIPSKSVKRKSDSNGTSETPQPPKKVVLNRNTPIIMVQPENKTEEDHNGDDDEKKVIKLSNISPKERLEMRAKKFNVPLGSDAKKVVRGERFSGGAKQPLDMTKVDTSADVLKKRAERFGGAPSVVVDKSEYQERVEKRKQRFGIVSAEDKAKQRLERFKGPVK